MKKEMLVVSVAAMMVALTGCCNTTGGKGMKAVDQPMKQDKEFMDQAIRHRSPDVMKVDIVGNTVIYTHIYDGIVDVKSYTYDGDVCVSAERVYTFPNQMRALRHYRRAIETAELYDNIELFNNQVKYTLKKDQHKLETKGLTKEQLKAKFDKQISDVKAGMAEEKAKFDKEKAKMKKDFDKKECCRKDGRQNKK